MLHALSGTPCPVLHQPSRGARRPPCVRTHASGNWVDVSNFVTSGGETKGPFQELADKIGKDVYLDVSGWHVYLRDVKVEGAPLHSVLAEGLGPGATKGASEADTQDFLKKIPVKLGGGKSTVPLDTLIPSYPLQDLQKILEGFGKD